MDCENRPIFIYLLLIHIKVHSKPMQRSPQHHKDMPDKVHPLGVLHKWNHAERIDNTTAHNPSQKRLVISEPVWNEHDGAHHSGDHHHMCVRTRQVPTDTLYAVLRHRMERPLHTEQHYSKHIFPVHKVHRSKCSAYQQIYRGIVKSSPDTLDC